MSKAWSKSLSNIEKAAVTAACQSFIDVVLKPRFLAQICSTGFNYPVDILGRWHGTRYRFLQRYRSGFTDNRGHEFEAPFTRLDWIGPNRFDIYWHRHTGAWLQLYNNLPLAKALKAIETDGHPHPL